MNGMRTIDGVVIKIGNIPPIRYDNHFRSYQIILL